MNNKIIPGVLEKDWTEIEKKIEIISQFSKEIHIDFIDQSFSQNTTFLDPLPFSKFTKELYLEAHLQVNEPLNYLKALSKAGFKKFIGNIEKMSSQEEFVAKGELLGEVGLGLNLGSSRDQIKVPFEDLDCILLLCIPANESGLNFDQSSIQKIKDLRSRISITIEVDGGINDQTLPLAKEAGANFFVSTSFITEASEPSISFQKLKILL